MCLACDMEALWFAVMEAQAAAGAQQPDEAVPQGEAVPQQDETVEQDEAAPARDEPLLPSPKPDETATLLPPPERGRVGEGVAGGMYETVGNASDESADPHPNPPPEEGGGGSPSGGEGAADAPERSNSARRHSAPRRRFACEETSGE
jgi:hypothetical protein